LRPRRLQPAPLRVLVGANMPAVLLEVAYLTNAEQEEQLRRSEFQGRVARAIADAGADALTAINTLSGIAVGPGRKRPLLGNIYGGLSGPAIKPIALRIVYEAAQVVTIPVIGIGGVTGLDDVLDFLAVGAVAVQVGTAIFADPTLPVRLVDDLADECGRRALASYRDLIGTALPERAGQPSSKGVEYRP